MLKQGIKQLTLNFSNKCIIPTFFCPAQTLCNLVIKASSLFDVSPKSKKTMETSLDLTLSFKSSNDTRVEGLVSNVDYSENRHRNFIQKKYGRKRHLMHTRFVLWTVTFLFVLTFCTLDDSLR